MLRFGDIVNTVQDARRDKPFDCFFKIMRPGAFTDSTVHELFIGLGKLGDYTAEHHENTSAVNLSIVFGKVIFIDFNPLRQGTRQRSADIR